MKSIKKYGKRFIPLFVLFCMLFCSFDLQNVYASDDDLSPSFDTNFFCMGYSFSTSFQAGSEYTISNSPCTEFLNIFVKSDTYSVHVIPVAYPASSGFGVKYFLLSNSIFDYTVYFSRYFPNEDVLQTDDSLSDSTSLISFGTHHVFKSLSEIPYSYLYSDSSILSDMQDLAISYIDGLCPDDSIFPVTPSSWSDSFEDAVDEIGYLQNISCRTKNVDVSSSHSLPVLKFFFSTTTTTGKKLYDDGMDVQYMLTAQSYNGKSAFDSRSVYKSAKSDLFLLSMNEHIYDEENSLEKGFFNFSSASDTWQNMYSEIKDGLSAFSNMYFIREFFIRPIYRENVFSPIQYGGWSKVIIDTDGNIDVQDGYINQSDDNPDSSPDSDGNLDNVTNEYEGEHSIGSGDNEYDAESNAKEWDKVFDTVDDVMDSFDNFDIRSLDDIFNQLSQGVKGFANLFNIVFSWVPQWLRYSIVAAISIWVFMLIKKAIFG